MWQLKCPRAKVMPPAWRRGGMFDIQAIMYFAIGFFGAAILALLFIPLVHNRSARLTRKNVEAAMPLTVAEVRADKDQLRAGFAMTTRRLEMSVERMKELTAAKLSDLGKKTDAINTLRKELGEKTHTIDRLQEELAEKAVADKKWRKRADAAEAKLKNVTAALQEAERKCSEKEAELVDLVAQLGEQTAEQESRRQQLDSLRAEVEDIMLNVAEYRRTLHEPHHLS
jgi:chromosome segregation ATPase